jgi:hypothetical protein
MIGYTRKIPHERDIYFHIGKKPVTDWIINVFAQGETKLVG